ncbi:unannotated protein [freshwater metagenome]|uniref:Unannotated protein n=1 Tax=freshwater metagenome TaxID=449393 RepID=A0A6J6T4I4_9ZZZZ|nr:hypothetical protein [Actinomycetota bacterium]
MPSPATLRQRAPRLAGAAVERARLTVVPRAETRAARLPFVSLVTVLLLGGVVGLLLFNTSMQQSAFTATSLEQRAAVLSARQESLGMKLEQLRDPQEVARRAQQLGMRVPAAPLFLDLSDGSVAGDPAGAQVLAPVLLEAKAPPLPAELAPATQVVRPPEGTLSGDRGNGNGNGNGNGRADDRAGDRGNREGRGDGRGDAARSDRGGRNGEASSDRDRGGDRERRDDRGRSGRDR